MKKLIFSALFIAGASFGTANYAIADGGDPICGDCTFYKDKVCLFKPDRQCSGNGSDCGFADPCGN